MLIVLRRRRRRRPGRGVPAARAALRRPGACSASAAWSPRSSRSSRSPGGTAPPAAPRCWARSPSTARRCSCRAPSCWSACSASCSSPNGASRAGPRRTATRGGSMRSPRRRRRSPAVWPRRWPTKAGVIQTEVFPLTLFAVGGMLLFPAADDLLTMFVALEVLSLPLYLLCGLARRRRLLSQEAALKYFLLGAFSSAFFLYGVALLYGYAGTLTSTRHRRRASALPTTGNDVAGADRRRAAVGRPAVQGRRGAVPLVDSRRLPGRADADHRVHGRRHQDRRVRRAAAASSTSRCPAALTTGGRCCGRSRS